MSKYKDDLIPHLPFSMIPTAIILHLRKKLGTRTLLKAARTTNNLIDAQNFGRPSGKSLDHC